MSMNDSYLTSMCVWLEVEAEVPLWFLFMYISLMEDLQDICLLTNTSCRHGRNLYPLLSLSRFLQSRDRTEQESRLAPFSLVKMHLPGQSTACRENSIQDD